MKKWMAGCLVGVAAGTFDIIYRPFHVQVVKDLKSAGIDPSKLDDKTLVEQVSNWAMNRSKFNDQFGLWMVEFDNGKPTIPADLKSEFDGQEPKGLPLQTIFNQKLYGKASP